MIQRGNKYKTHQTETSIHTGNMLKAYYAAHRIRKSPLARHLGRKVTTIADYLKNTSIQTAILWEISFVLKHNFFMDIAAKLPPEFSTDAPINSEKDERILALEKQVVILTAERDVLLKAMKS